MRVSKKIVSKTIFIVIARLDRAIQDTAKGLDSRKGGNDGAWGLAYGPFSRRRGYCDMLFRISYFEFRISHLFSISALFRVPKFIFRVLFFVLISSPALAHQETGSITGIVSGLKHPVSGMDHVLAMISVGLWGAQLGAPAVWVLPVAFPMVMAFGGMLGLMGVPLPGIEVGIAVSALVLGSMIFAEVRPPLWVAAVIVGFFAIFHGHAHGTELPAGSSGLLYSIGFVMATGTLHGVGITIGLVHRWKRGRLAIRLAGGMVALAGIFFLLRVFW